MHIENYIQFFNQQLLRWESPINPPVSLKTKEFLVRIGLPSNNSLLGSNFFPLINQGQNLSINENSYFIIACVSYSGDGKDLLIGVENISDKIYFINLFRAEIDFVNSQIEYLALYLAEFCTFFKTVEDISGQYDQQLQTQDLTQMLIHKEFKDLVQNLISIDKTALVEGKFWHKFWISNFLLSFMEFISTNEVYDIMDEALKLSS